MKERNTARLSIYEAAFAKVNTSKEISIATKYVKKREGPDPLIFTQIPKFYVKMTQTAKVSLFY